MFYECGPETDSDSVSELRCNGDDCVGGCKSDCKDTYESDVEACHSTYDDPDDADDLKQCIEDAKDAYDSCIEECDN